MGGTIAIIIISIIEPVFRAKKERGNNKNACQYDQDYLDIYHWLFLTAIFCLSYRVFLIGAVFNNALLRFCTQDKDSIQASRGAKAERAVRD